MPGRSRPSSANSSGKNRLYPPLFSVAPSALLGFLLNPRGSALRARPWLPSGRAFGATFGPIGRVSEKIYFANGKIGSMSTGTLFSLSSACCMGGLMTAYLSNIPFAVS